MHALGGILLGLINVAIVVAILLLIGLVILLIFQYLLNIGIDQRIQRIYMVIVALIALYMIVQILLGVPTINFLGGRHGGMGVVGYG
jgi:uncharacterized membrane protein